MIWIIAILLVIYLAGIYPSFMMIGYVELFTSLMSLNQPGKNAILGLCLAFLLFCLCAFCNAFY